jgi:serine/threonine protein kinase
VKDLNSQVGCPDENSLLAYTRGLLSVRGRAEVESHIDGCSSCRRVLATLAKDLSVKATGQHSLEVATDPNIGGMMPMPGARLADRFKLARIIGRGAMGIVFEAHDEKMNERMALKLLAPHISSRPDVLEMLRREISLGRKISHPNVCRLYDMGFSGEFKFITLQLVEGHTLEETWESRKLTLDEGVQVLEQLASALAAAHQTGVVHRDLKAANVMLGANNHVWVMDFGLARDLEKDPSFSGPVGTPAYWSPEQSHGEPASPASDVFSFGVIAYKLFTGHLPRRHVQKPSMDQVPRRYRAFVAKCMAERMSERYRDGSALYTALTQLRTRPLQNLKRAAVVSLGLGITILAAAISYSSARAVVEQSQLEKMQRETRSAAPVRPPSPAPPPTPPPPVEAPPPVQAVAPVEAAVDAGDPKRRVILKKKNDFPIFE